MPDFIAFHRSGGHCSADMVRADSLCEALQKFLAYSQGAKPIAGSATVECEGIVFHVLELIEAVYKSDRKYDELQLDKYDLILNENNWLINRVRPESAENGVTPILCSYEPYSVSNYIELCRKVFRKAYPRSRARAFVWYLSDGPLVTFYRVRDSYLTRPLEILGRYLIRWQKDKYPHPYEQTSEMVEEWLGTYDDMLEQFVS